MNPSTKYLKTLQSSHSKTTMESLLNVAAGLLSKGSNRMSYDWSLLTADLIEDIKQSLLVSNKSPATINSYLSALKGVAKACWRKELMEINTYLEIKEIKKIKGSRKSTGRALTKEELNQILDNCIQTDGAIALRDATLIALMYGAGLRRSEAAQLTLKSYNGESIRTIGKGNKERSSDLHSRIVELLECWLELRGAEPGPLFTRVLKGDKITLEAISPQTVYNIAKKRYKEAGIDGLTPHDLRKTFATNLLKNGVDVFLVQELMGHANIETTKLYDKRDTEEEKALATKALPL